MLEQFTFYTAVFSDFFEDKIDKKDLYSLIIEVWNGTSIIIFCT